MEERGSRQKRGTALAVGHPTACYFLDESGSISKDRFFVVGLVKCQEPHRLIRDVQRLRDRLDWREEIHFTKLTRNRLPYYLTLVEELGKEDDLQFWAFVADRDVADPVARWGTQWLAYEKLAEQLLVAGIKPEEVSAVIADAYSTPESAAFERDTRNRVNKRLRRCAVATMLRADSRSMEGLQVADLLTSAVAHEFRQAAGLAGSSTPKAVLAARVREAFDLEYTVFTDTPVASDRFSVRMYEHGKWRG